MRIMVPAVALACTACHPGVILKGDELGGTSTLTYEHLRRTLEVTLQVASETADPRLHNRTLEAFEGFDVYTRETHVFVDPLGRQVLGWTRCSERKIVVGQPASGWYASALVHELLHVLQDCKGSLPIDAGCDGWHANWTRDGVFKAILRARGVQAEDAVAASNQEAP